MKRTSRALLVGLTLSLLAACTPSDNGGVIQGPAPTGATTTTSTTVAHPGGGTLAPG